MSKGLMEEVFKAVVSEFDGPIAVLEIDLSKKAIGICSISMNDDISIEVFIMGEMYSVYMGPSDSEYDIRKCSDILDRIDENSEFIAISEYDIYIE